MSRFKAKITFIKCCHFNVSLLAFAMGDTNRRKPSKREVKA